MKPRLSRRRAEADGAPVDEAFALSAAALPVRDEIRAELRQEWRRLASAGTWFDGAARVAVAAEARAARQRVEAGTGLPPPVGEAAQAVSAAAAFVDRDWVDDLVRRGLAIEEYVEVCGVVGRLAAVDAYVAGVGAPQEPLPDPLPGEPSRQPSSAARRRAAFVPTDPGDQPPSGLSAVPAEARALLDLHTALYLPVERMGELAYRGDLSRPQMEFVAARTSQLNDCRY